MLKQPQINNKERCQCDPNCMNPPLPKSAFCSLHRGVCKRHSPLTGWEPKLMLKFINEFKEFINTHNCFAYAMNILDPKQIKNCVTLTGCNVPFHQPGSAAGHEPFTAEKPKTCPDMMSRILGDNPGIRPTTFEKRCPNKTSKIALVVDEDEDYHFLRQDSNGWWSQKGGAKPVTNLDASGRPIWDPQLANHNWTNAQGPLDYDIFCGFLCVPRVDPLYIKTGGRHTRRLSGRRAPRSKKIRISKTKRSKDRRV